MDAKLYALLEGKSWEPFCIVAFTRHLALLDLGKGTQAELALDSGTIQAGEKCGASCRSGAGMQGGEYGCHHCLCG